MYLNKIKAYIVCMRIILTDTVDEKNSENQLT